MAEKRNISRKRKRIRLRFGPEEPKKMAFTDDISFDGLFIKTATPEIPGVLLHIEIILPDETQVLCKGRIHWAKRVPANMLRLAGKAGMGVKLLSFTQGEQGFIEFVESLQR